MAGKRKPRYSGALNQPITPIFNGLLLPKEVFGTHVLSQRNQKLNLLLVHYNIDPKESGRWQKLAFCLAVEHVPGMRVTHEPGRGRGRPSEWNITRDREFVAMIDEIKRDRNHGIRDAIRMAKKRMQLIGRVEGLERRYRESRKRLQRLHEKIDEFKRRRLSVTHKLADVYDLPLLMARRPRAHPVEKKILRFRIVG